MTGRRQFAPPQSGVVKVRVSGDLLADKVAAALVNWAGESPAVELISGPDHYEEGNRYYLVLRLRLRQEQQKAPGLKPGAFCCSCRQSAGLALAHP